MREKTRAASKSSGGFSSAHERLASDLHQKHVNSGSAGLMPDKPSDAGAALERGPVTGGGDPDAVGVVGGVAAAAAAAAAAGTTHGAESTENNRPNLTLTERRFG